MKPSRPPHVPARRPCALLLLCAGLLACLGLGGCTFLENEFMTLDRAAPAGATPVGAAEASTLTRP